MARRAPYGSKKRKPVSTHPVPLTVSDPPTDKEELALAIVLWKSLRCHCALTAHTSYPTEESERLGEKSIDLAKLAGVKDEFFKLLFAMKLIKVTVKVME